MPVVGEEKTWPDGMKSRWDGEKWVLDGGPPIVKVGPLTDDGFMGVLREIQGSDGDASSQENWMPGAFGKASWVPGNANFRPCEWLYETTGIKCWWIIAAAAVYLTVRAVMSHRGR